MNQHAVFVSPIKLKMPFFSFEPPDVAKKKMTALLRKSNRDVAEITQFDFDEQFCFKCDIFYIGTHSVCSC